MYSCVTTVRGQEGHYLTPVNIHMYIPHRWCKLTTFYGYYVCIRIIFSWARLNCILCRVRKPSVLGCWLVLALSCQDHQPLHMVVLSYIENRNQGHNTSITVEHALKEKKLKEWILFFEYHHKDSRPTLTYETIVQRKKEVNAILRDGCSFTVLQFH